MKISTGCKGILFILIILFSTVALGQDENIKTLIDTYDSNQARFHQRYRGELLKGYGIVSDITTDIFGEGNSFNIELDVNNSSIQCETKNQELAASLDKGNRVQFEGKIYDIVYNNVILKDCKFSKIKTTVEHYDEAESSPLNKELSLYISSEYPDAKNDFILESFNSKTGKILNIVHINSSEYCGGNGGCPVVISMITENYFKILYDDICLGAEFLAPSSIKLSFHGSVCNLPGYQQCEIVYEVENYDFVKKFINNQPVPSEYSQHSISNAENYLNRFKDIIRKNQ